MTEDRKMTGGCLCENVRYVISGEPKFVKQCCCKDCQKATGTGHTTIVGMHRDQLAVTGPIKTFTNTGGTGGSVTRHFCETCGGRIFTSGTLPGVTIMVQAGSLDDPSRVTPTSVIYTKDATSWDRFDPALPTFPAMPPRPAQPSA